MKKANNFTLFSRHPSHAALREVEFNLPVPTVMRLGSVTTGKKKYAVEINTPNAVRISANKRLMKQAFDSAGVKTARWFTWIKDDTFLMNNKEVSVKEVLNEYGGFVMKNVFGSRGTGNYLIKSVEDWENLKKKK